MHPNILLVRFARAYTADVTCFLSFSTSFLGDSPPSTPGQRAIDDDTACVFIYRSRLTFTPSRLLKPVCSSITHKYTRPAGPTLAVCATVFRPRVVLSHPRLLVFSEYCPATRRLSSQCSDLPGSVSLSKSIVRLSCARLSRVRSPLALPDNVRQASCEHTQSISVLHVHYSPRSPCAFTVSCDTHRSSCTLFCSTRTLCPHLLARRPAIVITRVAQLLRISCSWHWRLPACSPSHTRSPSPCPVLSKRYVLT
jgi:hypothetical protein